MITPYPHGPDKLRGPGLAAREKTKLWIFGILFILVLGAFFGTMLWGRKADPKLAESPAAERLKPVEHGPKLGPDGEPAIEYVPPTAAVQRDAAEEEIRGELKAFRDAGKLDDGAGDLAPEVLEYLLRTVHTNVQVTGVSETFHRRLPEERVLAAPAEWCGAFTTAFGRIERKGDPVPFTTTDESLDRQVDDLHVVDFRTAEGHLYRLVASKPVERPVGDWIQAYGLFVRLTKLPKDGGMENVFTLLGTKPPSAAYPPRVVEKIDPDWAKQIRENDYEGANNLDEPPFWLILNYVKNLGLEGYRELRKSGEFEILPTGDPAQVLASSPDLYRFAHVFAEGRIIEPGREHLTRDNPGKIETFDIAILYQPSSNFLRLVSPIPWSEYGIDLKDTVVRVEGVFYKRWEYEPRMGGPPLPMPLLIVTDVIPIPTGRQETWKPLIYGLIGVGLAFIVGFCVYVVRGARQRGEARQRTLAYREKRQAEKKRAGGGDGGDASS